MYMALKNHGISVVYDRKSHFYIPPTEKKILFKGLRKEILDTFLEGKKCVYRRKEEGVFLSLFKVRSVKTA